jgi:hypothetical protein
MAWWKAHQGIANDPKLALVTIDCNRQHETHETVSSVSPVTETPETPCNGPLLQEPIRRGEVLSVWVALLDYANGNDPRGSIEGCDPEQLGWMLDMPPARIAIIIKAFETRVMIVDNVLTAWEKRQSAGTSTARVKAWREKQRAAKLAAQQREVHETVSPVSPVSETPETHRQDKTIHTEERNCVPMRVPSSVENDSDIYIHDALPIENKGFSTPRLWSEDAQYSAFVAEYKELRTDLIDNDFAEAWQNVWRRFDFNQKLERIASLRRHAEEYAARNHMAPNPTAFLRHEWERPVREHANGAAAGEQKPYKYTPPPNHLSNAEFKRKQAQRQKEIEDSYREDKQA